MLEQIIKSIVKNTVAYTNSQITQVKAGVATEVHKAVTEGLGVAQDGTKGIILQNIESSISNNALIGTNGRLNQLIGEGGLNALIGEGGLVDQINSIASMTEAQLDQAINGIISQVAVGPQPLPPGNVSTTVSGSTITSSLDTNIRDTIVTDTITMAGK